MDIVLANEAVGDSIFSSGVTTFDRPVNVVDNEASSTTDVCALHVEVPDAVNTGHATLKEVLAVTVPVVPILSVAVIDVISISMRDPAMTPLRRLWS